MYETPTMEVVDLQQHTCLLAGSGTDAILPGYGDGGDEEWGSRLFDDSMDLLLK